MYKLLNTQTILLRESNNPTEESYRSYGIIRYNDPDNHHNLNPNSTYYYLDLNNSIPFLESYEYVLNYYSNAEQISNLVSKTWKIIFENPIKFKFGDELHINGTVHYSNNIYFNFVPTLIQWKKWKNQTVNYDKYSHYFVYLDNKFIFSNGGYGSHMEIKSRFYTDSDDNEYTLIEEIEFYHVKDPDNTIKINDIRRDIFDFNQKILT